MTAHHVIEGAIQSSNRAAYIGGQPFHLEKIPVFLDRQNDLAVFDLEDLVQANPDNDGLKAKAVRLDEREIVPKVRGLFIAIGYPSSQNRLAPALHDVDQRLYGVSLIESSRNPPRLKSGVKDRLLFDFDRKAILNGSGKAMNPPPLNGMSGGPILELYFDDELSRPHDITPVIQAVFTEEHREHKVIVGSARCALDALVEKAVGSRGSF